MNPKSRRTNKFDISKNFQQTAGQMENDWKNNELKWYGGGGGLLSRPFILARNQTDYINPLLYFCVNVKKFR